MENRIKKNPLAISLLLLSATFAAAGLSMVTLLSTTTQVISANASILTGAGAAETNESIMPRSSSNKNTVTLADKGGPMDQAIDTYWDAFNKSLASIFGVGGNSAA
jgi:hypothetical protein